MESDLPRTPARTVVGVVLGVVAAVALLVGSLLFALYGWSGIRRWVAAATLSILSSAAFVAGLWGLAAFVLDDSGVVFLLGLLVLVGLWLWLTAAAARRAEGRSLSRE